jgi:RNase P/RNase MRP subunit p30
LPGIRVVAMRRIYADLHLFANICEKSQLETMVNEAARLGYGSVSIPLPFNVTELQVQEVRDACEQTGLNFASRVDLKPRSPEELLRDLRRVRRRFEIVAVMCFSKAVARQAAKDRRVDLLNFPQPDFRRAFFDKAEAELTSNCLASLEIDVKPLLSCEGPSRVRLLMNLQREVEVAKVHDVPIVVSTGVSERLLMRKPTELAALGTLFGLQGELCKAAVSSNPMTIVKRNKEKLSWRFVAPGIRIVRKGENCSKE